MNILVLTISFDVMLNFEERNEYPFLKVSKTVGEIAKKIIEKIGR